MESAEQELQRKTITLDQYDELIKQATFHKKTQLKRHTLEEHDEGWLICNEHCGKKFKSQKYLDAHLARVKENWLKTRGHMYTFQSGIEDSFQSICSLNSSQEGEIQPDFLLQNTARIQYENPEVPYKIQKTDLEVKRRNSEDN